MNAAYANNGYQIHVEKNVHLKDSIEVIFLSKNTTNNFIQYRNRIDLNENSSIKIIEHFKCLDKNLCFTNSLTNINLDKSSNIEFNKLQNHNDFQIVVDNTIINQDEKSYSTINTLLLGGKFTRNNLSFYQNGEYCESNMNGVVILNNNEFGDNHTYVDHKNANCESNELYKGIYLDKSKGVFNGKIMVRPDAQKINAFQANNNLLLSENSSINSKPQLEIYADDVKCSHGCTIGQLDDNALFYMRTRGISKEDAKTILTFAFASEAIETSEKEEESVDISVVRSDAQSIKYETIEQAKTIELESAKQTKQREINVHASSAAEEQQYIEDSKRLRAEFYAQDKAREEALIAARLQKHQASIVLPPASAPVLKSVVSSPRLISHYLDEGVFLFEESFLVEQDKMRHEYKKAVYNWLLFDMTYYTRDKDEISQNEYESIKKLLDI